MSETVCKRVEINGHNYVREDIDADDLGVRIVVLQRGWVVVGHARRVRMSNALGATPGDWPCRVVVSNCAIVRRWGTSKGLGELATNGPLTNTVLDDCPDVECLESEVVLSMQTAEEKWRDRQ